MRKRNEVCGIITPLITPIKKGVIDYDAVQKLVEFLIKSKVDGMFPTGSTGYAPILSIEMHKDVISAFSDVNKKLKFFVGVGRNSIEETVEVADYAIDVGADAVIVPTPYYMRLNQKSIFNYYDKVIPKIDSGVILYNIPQLTSNWIYPDTILRLVEKHNNIIGLKESSGDFRKFAYYMAVIKNKIPILQGQDDLLLSSLSIGASGGICGTTNFMDIAAKVYNTFKKKNTKEATEYQMKLVRVMNLLSEQYFPRIYNYLFYKRIMARDETNILEIYDNENIDEGKGINGSIDRILQK